MTVMSTPMMLAASDKVRESLIAGMCLKQKPMQKQQSIIQSLINLASLFLLFYFEDIPFPHRLGAPEEFSALVRHIVGMFFQSPFLLRSSSNYFFLALHLFYRKHIS